MARLRERERLTSTPRSVTPDDDRSDTSATEIGFGERAARLRQQDRARGSVALDGSTRADAEAGFGHSFAGLRIFPEASSADALGASAYALGSDLYIARGGWPPIGTSGRALLGHELAHVVQQRGNQPAGGRDAAEAEASRAGSAFAAGMPAVVGTGAARAVQRQPKSQTQLWAQRADLESRLKNPDLSAAEEQQLRTELEGVILAISGVEHDPASYDGAAFIISQAGTLLHVDNMNGKWYPSDLPPVPDAFKAMLWDFWKARSGYDFVDRKRVNIGGVEQRRYLERGLAQARPLLDRVAAGGGPAQQWLETTFWKWQRMVAADTYYSEAKELVESTVKDAGAAMDAPQVQPVVGEREVMRGVIAVGLDTLRRLPQLVTRFQGNAMETEFAKVMASMNKGTPLPEALKNVDSMKFVQAAFYLRGILNTLDSALVLSSASDPDFAAKRWPNLFSKGVDLTWQITRMLEGTVVLTAGLTATVARLSGMASEAALALQIGSRALRVIGTIGAAFQTLYGFSVLFDPDATSAQRKEALLHIGLGGAGIGSLPTLWGGTRLWASGPWTVAVLWGALVAGYMNAMTTLMKQGLIVRGLRWSYESLQLRANRIVEDARELEAALLHLRYLPAPSGDQPDASLAGGMTVVARQHADSLRDSVDRTLELATTRSAWFIEREPGDFYALRRRFLPLRDVLAKAKQPEEVLAAGMATLDTIRTAFQETDIVIQEEFAR